jgi:hypothetical protein
LDAAPDPGLEAALARAGMAVDLAQRLACDVALERLLLEHASRLVNDGPSPVEAADEERFLRRLRGRWRVRP